MIVDIILFCILLIGGYANIVFVGVRVWVSSVDRTRPIHVKWGSRFREVLKLVKNVVIIFSIFIIFEKSLSFSLRKSASVLFFFSISIFLSLEVFGTSMQLLDVCFSPFIV